jgi:polyhydroxyalkanoate synthase
MTQQIQESYSRLTEAFGSNIDLSLKLFDSNLKSLLSPTNRPAEHYKGITPFETLYQFDEMRVLKFKGRQPLEHQTPLLLVPSMINRSYVMDLMENNSLVADMVAQGIPTYMIDWGNPGTHHDHLPFSFFFDDLISSAIRAIREDTGFGKVGLLGYCMAGTMSLFYAALHPDKIDRLTLLASPVNFHDEGTLSKWATPEVFDVERLVNTIGHADALMLQTSFLFVKPLAYYQKLKSVYETSSDPKMYQSFVRLETWVNDNTNVPGRAYAEYVKLCYHDNAVIQGSFALPDRTIDLKNVTCPVMNVVATKDHIVPIESSRIVAKLITGPITEVPVEAGHIGVVMGRKARKMFESVANFHKGTHS